MFPVATSEAGECLAFPDVNMQVVGPSTVPVPLPNTAKMLQARADTLTRKVRIRNKPVVIGSTVIVISNGDNTAQSGVKSGRTMGETFFPQPSRTVRAEGIGVVTQFDVTGQNAVSRNNNSMGFVVVASQTQVTASK